MMNNIVRQEYFMENVSEEDFGQIHAIHLNQDAVAEARRKIEESSKRESREDCEDCGEEIPEPRRAAVKGVQKCVYCQELSERR